MEQLWREEQKACLDHLKQDMQLIQKEIEANSQEAKNITSELMQLGSLDGMSVGPDTIRAFLHLKGAE